MSGDSWLRKPRGHAGRGIDEHRGRDQALPGSTGGTRLLPMSYSDMTLEIVRSRFGIALSERPLFPNPGRIPPTPWLQTALAKGNGMAVFSEKARNEMIVTPVL